MRVKSLQRVTLIQLAMLGIGALGLDFAGSSQEFPSLLVVGFLLLANWWLLAFSWGLILQKKLIALAVSIIVTKYAILALMLTFGLREGFLTAGGVVGAITTLLAAVFLEAALPAVLDKTSS